MKFNFRHKKQCKNTPLVIGAPGTGRRQNNPLVIAPPPFEKYTNITSNILTLPLPTDSNSTTKSKPQLILDEFHTFNKN